MKIASNLSDHEKNLLFLLFTLLILFCAYQFGYVPFTERADNLHNENLLLTSRLNELQIKKNQEEKFITETKDYEDKINEMLEEFPVRITQEKNIMLINELEGYADVKISSINFGDSSNFYTGSLQKGNASDSVETITGYSTSIVLTYQTSYEGLKKSIDFIHENDKKMNITGITAAFDNTTGNLTGTLTIMLYALDGMDKQEEEVKIPGIEIGVDNIFDSFDSSVLE